MKRLLTALSLMVLSACDGRPWNHPYPAAEDGQSIFYTAFTERPKHLDPAQAYSENEYDLLALIYMPPLQYHYLKRPYQLVPLAAEGLPKVIYLDRNRRPLPAQAAAERIAYSVYEIHIKRGMRYQPHPAFVPANHAQPLDERIGKIGDFPHTATREVVAADYVYQIKRLVHPRLHTPIAGVMGEYIVGLKEYAATLRAAADADPDGYLDLEQYPLAGVEVVDRYTYRITINGKYPQFLYWLAMPFFSPMPPEAERFYARPGMKERNFSLDWWPVGSGPYYLSENDPNRRMVLTRNPYYDYETYPSEGEPGDAEAGLLDDAGRPLPFIDRVVFSLEKETIPYWNKFLQGYYDISGISSDSFDQAVSVGVSGEASVSDAMRAQGIVLETAVSASTMYIGFNMLDPVIGGNTERARRLRRAIAIALDFEEFVTIFANGRGISAQSPIPPGIFGHRPGCAGVNRYVYDCVNGEPKRKPISEAQRLMAEAGYPGGIDARSGQPLVVHFDTTVTGMGNKSRLDWLRKQFSKIGIQLDVRSTDYNRFQDKLRHGDAQLFFYGWNADYPDPENFFFLLHGAQGKAKYGGENASNYSEPEFDLLFGQMRNMENTEARQAIIDRMLEILRRDSPWLWGYHPKNYVLRHGWVGNVKPGIMINNKLKYWRIDAAQRDRQRRAWNQPVLGPLWYVVGGIGLFVLGAWLALKKQEKMR